MNIVSSLSGLMTMLANTPCLAGALVVTFGLLGVEVWVVRGQSRTHAGRAPERQ